MTWSFSWSGLACDYDPSLVAGQGEDRIYGGIVQDQILHLLEPLGQEPVAISVYGHSVLNPDGKPARGTNVSISVSVLEPVAPQASEPQTAAEGTVQPSEDASEPEGDPQEAAGTTAAAPEQPPAPVLDQPSQPEA